MNFPARRIPLLLMIILGVPLLWCLWVGIYAMGPGPSSSREQIEVIIPARSSLSTIGKILAEKKVIRPDPRFSMLATLTGAGSRLRAGEYAFAPGKKPLEVIELLKKGKVLYRPVTIPEGTEMTKFAAILAADGWVDLEKFLHLVRDPAMLKKTGIHAESLEGYLFPDTYFLSRGQLGEAKIIEMMVARHFQIYNALIKNQNSDTFAMSHHEVVILASIVEKETGNPEERALVASVFLNRLQRGMRLQADPTVRYGLEENTGQLTKADLKKSTPYNTYIIEGLPPGPIANPGRAAIEAVIFPARTDYLYFVAKDDKSHHFSRTLKEHNKAVSRYRAGK